MKYEDNDNHIQNVNIPVSLLQILTIIGSISVPDFFKQLDSALSTNNRMVLNHQPE